MPNYRLNLPDYSDRAIFEGLVNHLIHRDYTVMGGEVHIDIYDDRVELVSPGAMLDGTQIQDRDIYNVPSIRPQPPSLPICLPNSTTWRNVVPVCARCVN